MVLDPNRTLGRLADAITDETPIDWTTEQSFDPDLVASLEKLRLIERIAEVYRDPWATSGPEAGPTLFEWGHLQVRAMLGEGGCGMVYRALDPRLQREVALKLLREDREGRALDRHRFVEEARRMARVRHPNVLVIHGAEEHAGRVGFWSDLVDGETLEARLRRDGPLGAGEAGLIGIELCRALAAVHQAGVVHGDVKGSNVMRDRRGRIVLTDFGAGSEPGSDHATGARRGTPVALAPELLEGKVPGPTADLYALGVLLFRLVTGRYPIQSEDLAGLRERHRRGERPALLDLRPDLPPAFVHAVDRALAPDPASRFRTAGEMERELMAAAVPPGAPVAGITGPRAQGKRSRTRAIVFGCLAFGAIIAVALSLHTRMQERDAEAPANRIPGPGPSSSAQSSAAPRSVSEPAIPASGTRTGGTPAISPTPDAALAVEATLFRSLGGAREALPAGALVHPGDSIFLEVKGSSAMHVYVLNEDQEGRVYLLFPLPGLDLENPLAQNTRHRLPGAQAGITQDWQVTSGQGNEDFLIVAARRPVDTLEARLHDLPRAEKGRPVEPVPLDPRSLTGTRGVGGMTASGTPSGTPTGRTLSEIARYLVGAASEPGGLWVREFAVYNLGR